MIARMGLLTCKASPRQDIVYSFQEAKGRQTPSYQSSVDVHVVCTEASSAVERCFVNVPEDTRYQEASRVGRTERYVRRHSRIPIAFLLDRLAKIIPAVAFAPKEGSGMKRRPRPCERGESLGVRFEVNLYLYDYLC
jgi:hypothetical protein